MDGVGFLASVIFYQILKLPVVCPEIIPEYNHLSEISHHFLFIPVCSVFWERLFFFCPLSSLKIIPQPSEGSAWALEGSFYGQLPSLI